MGKGHERGEELRRIDDFWRRGRRLGTTIDLQTQAGSSRTEAQTSMLYAYTLQVDPEGTKSYRLRGKYTAPPRKPLERQRRILPPPAIQPLRHRRARGNIS
jgi:hypothetical protein